MGGWHRAQSMKWYFLSCGFVTGEVKREGPIVCRLEYSFFLWTPFLKNPFSLHDDPVGLETSPELFISVHSTHKAPSGDAPFWEWE